MKKFRVILEMSTTGNHNTSSIEQWLTDLIKSAMESPVETNTLQRVYAIEQEPATEAESNTVKAPL